MIVLQHLASDNSSPVKIANDSTGIWIEKSDLIFEQPSICDASIISPGMVFNPDMVLYKIGNVAATNPTKIIEASPKPNRIIASGASAIPGIVIKADTTYSIGFVVLKRESKIPNENPKLEPIDKAIKVRFMVMNKSAIIVRKKSEKMSGKDLTKF